MNERRFGKQRDNTYNEELGVVRFSIIFIYSTVLTCLLDLYCKICPVYSLHCWLTLGRFPAVDKRLSTFYAHWKARFYGIRLKRLALDDTVSCNACIYISQLAYPCASLSVEQYWLVEALRCSPLDSLSRFATANGKL